MTGSNPEGVIDMAVIEGLRELGGDDDPNLLVDLIELFLADAPSRIAEIRTSLATNDTRLLERAAHTLKSSCANIGAMQLSALCKRMEELARANATEDVPQLVEQTARAWTHVESALRHLKG